MGANRRILVLQFIPPPVEVGEFLLIMVNNTKTSTLSDGGFEASTRIELVIEVLQTFALPLGYDALFF